MSSGGKKQTVGYWYRLLQAFGLCKGPIDAFLEFRAGGRVAWRGSIDSTSRITVSAGNLWGGEKKEGGLIGEMDIQFGDADQMPNDYLTARLGADQSAYRGKAMAIWRGGRWGAMNPYPKRSEFKVRRIRNGWDDDLCWYPEKAEIVLVPEIAFIEDLKFSATNASLGPYAGITIDSGFTAEDVLIVTKPPGLTYQGWSYWDSDAEPIAEGLPWTNAFWVTDDKGVTTLYWGDGLDDNGAALNRYETAAEADTAYRTRHVYLTGSSSYTFWIMDEPASDNRGGLSLRVWKGGLIAMNAAHILYDSLTAHDMQRDPIDLINDASFRAAADVLHSEGMGLCTVYDDEDIDQFQERILNVIGAGLSQSRENGQYYLDLIRPTLDVSELVIIGSDDIQELTLEPSTLTEMVNQLSVKWFDPERNEARVTQPFQNLGAIQAAGRVLPEQSDYPEVPYEPLALRLAARDAQARGTPLSKLSLTTNRRGDIWKLRPGKKFRLQVPEDGISDMLCVVGDIDVGTLKDGRIKIKAVQDVYSMPATVYVMPELGLAPEINSAPVPSPNQRMIEAPYVELAASLTTADLEFFPEDAGFILTMASQPISGLNYALYSAPAGLDLVNSASGDWCPTGLVVEEAGHLTKGFTLTDGDSLSEVEVGTWALWDEEIVRVDAIDPELLAVELGRGCADTVPMRHAAGSRIWFCGDWGASDEAEYLDGETVTAKLATRSTIAELPLANTSLLSVEMVGRHSRPYPPGDFLINNEPYPETVIGEVGLAWAHRDRVTQADKLFDTTTTSVAPEPGTTYSARLLREDNQSILVAVSDITGTATSLQADYDGLVSVELWSVLGGVESFQRHKYSFMLQQTASNDPFWSNVSLLMHFDGVDGSTTFTDQKGNAVSRTGDTRIDTSQFVFGGASCLFDGVGDSLLVPYSESLDIGTGAVTLEARLRRTVGGANQVLVDFRGTASSFSAGWCLYITAANKLAIYNGVTNSNFVSALPDVPVNEFCSIAVDRSGSDWRLYLNGASSLVFSSGGSWVTHSTGMRIGGQHDSANWFQGNLDELRLTKGIARYQGPYTPSVDPFFNS